MKIKAHFRWTFEETKLEKAEKRKFRRVFYQVGGYGRTTMRRTVRRKRPDGRSAQKGEPPRDQTGAYKRTSRFEVDQRRYLYVNIGPTGEGGRSPVPHRIERGGTFAPTREQRRQIRRFNKSRANTWKYFNKPAPARMTYDPHPHIYSKEAVIHQKWRDFTREIPYQ